jgi:hypothetical protein
MSHFASPYYPPRRRWFGRVLWRVRALVRRLGLDAIPWPGIRSWLPAVLGLLVPGHGFKLTGQARLGRVLQIGYAVFVLIFFVGLGYPAANVAFGALISVHAASILQLQTLWVDRPGLQFRFIAGLGVWGILSLGAYFPLRDVVLERWLMPLKVDQGVVVVRRWGQIPSIQRGDVIAYRIEFNGSRNVSIGAGYGIDSVIARPGDHVRITPQWVLVNGQAQPREPHMPREVEFRLGEKQWFVWPHMAINSRQIAEATIAASWLSTGMIDETMILGRPFRHWFGRWQPLP